MKVKYSGITAFKHTGELFSLFGIQLIAVAISEALEAKTALGTLIR